MKRVLVVENDSLVREDIVEALAEHGYQVDEAAHGQEALTKLGLASEPPAAILLDLSTPVMNGWEFRTAQLEDARYRAIPVLIMSGNVDARSIALELGVAGVLRKPFDVTTLLSALRSVESAAG